MKISYGSILVWKKENKITFAIKYSKMKEKWLNKLINNNIKEKSIVYYNKIKLLYIEYRYETLKEIYDIIELYKNEIKVWISNYKGIINNNSSMIYYNIEQKGTNKKNTLRAIRKLIKKELKYFNNKVNKLSDKNEIEIYKSFELDERENKLLNDSSIDKKQNNISNEFKINKLNEKFNQFEKTSKKSKINKNILNDKTNLINNKKKDKKYLNELIELKENQFSIDKTIINSDNLIKESEISTNEPIINSDTLIQESKIKKNKSMKLDNKVLNKMLRCDGVTFLIKKIDNTITKMGKKYIAKEISEPSIDLKEILRRQKETKNFRNITIINKIQEILKDIPNIEKIISLVQSNGFDNNNNRIIKKSMLDTEFSCKNSIKINEIISKSIMESEFETDENELEDENIENHYKIIEILNGLCKLVYNSENLIKIEQKSTILQNIKKITMKDEYKRIIEIIKELVNERWFSFKMVIADSNAELLKDELDEYLDLARNIYKKNIEDLQSLLVDQEIKYGMKIFKDKEFGFCLKYNIKDINEELKINFNLMNRKNINKNNQKLKMCLNNSMIINIKTEYDLKKYKKLNESDRNFYLTKYKANDSLTESRTNEKFNLTEYKSNEKFNLTESRTNEKFNLTESRTNDNSNYNISESIDELIILKRYNNSILFTNEKIQFYNYKCQEVLDQIIEISGKKTKIIFKRKGIDCKILYLLNNAITELDFIISNACYVMNHNTIFPKFGDSIIIENFFGNILQHITPCSYNISYKLNCIAIEGPNGSGKHMYVSLLIQAIIMGQIGYGLLATTSQLIIIESIYYIDNISDLIDLKYDGYSTILVIIDEVIPRIFKKKHFKKLFLHRKILIIVITHDKNTVSLLKTFKNVIFKRPEYAYTINSEIIMLENYLPNKLVDSYNIYRNIIKKNI